MTNVIRSIQQVTISLSTSQSSNTATITSVTTANTMVIFDGWTTSVTATNAGQNSECRVDLTNATTVTITRGNGSTALAITAKATIIEFNTGVNSIQQGTIALTNVTSNTATISSVGSNAFVLWLGQSQAGAGNGLTNYNATVVLTNSTTVTATVSSSSANTLTVGYMVVDLTSTIINSVQPITKTDATSGTSYTSTIASVTTGNSFIAYNGCLSAMTGSNFDSIYHNLQLTNGTTVTYTRSGALGTSRTICGTVVEFKAAVLNSNVQRGTIAISAGTSNTATITSISTTYGFVNHAGFSTSGAAPNTTKTNLELTNATTLTSAVNSSGTTTVSYEAIEFAPPSSFTYFGLSAYPDKINKPQLLASTSMAAEPFLPSPIVQTFTISGAFVVPDGVKSLRIYAWGNGGDGAANVSAILAGGGGGGGAYSDLYANVSAGNVFTYTIGAHGSGTATTVTSSSPSVSISAGAGITASGATGGTNGTASGGDNNISGVAGATTAITTGGNGGNAGKDGLGGAGGAPSNPGVAGTSPGGGGGGGGAIAGSDVGGAGGDGKVVIVYYLGEDIKPDKWNPEYPDMPGLKVKPKVPEGKIVQPVGITAGETIQLDKWEPQYPDQVRKAKPLVPEGRNGTAPGITAKETTQPDKWLPGYPDFARKAKPLVPEGKYVATTGILSGENITLDKWEPYYPDAVKKAKPLVPEGEYITTTGITAKEAVTVDKWKPTYDTPAIRPKSVARYEQSFTPFIPPVIEIVTVDKWKNYNVDIINKKQSVARSEVFGAPFVPEIITLDKWDNTSVDLIRRIRATQEGYLTQVPYVPVVPPEVITPDKWLPSYPQGFSKPFDAALYITTAYIDINDNTPVVANPYIPQLGHPPHKKRRGEIVWIDKPQAEQSIIAKPQPASVVPEAPKAALRKLSTFADLGEAFAGKIASTEFNEKNSQAVAEVNRKAENARILAAQQADDEDVIMAYLLTN